MSNSSLTSKNVVEIKNEYTTFLINILTPLLYEGIKSVYIHAQNCDRQFIEAAKSDPNVKVPGVLKIFQMGLKEFSTLSQTSIAREVERIKTASKCSEWFDDLIKAVIKSNIALLTSSNSSSSTSSGSTIDPKFHEKVTSTEFINRCYLETSGVIYNNPELFYHDYPSLQIKKNQQEIYAIIKQCIEEAIRKTLPYNLILKAYLEDSNTNLPTNSQYLHVRDLVNSKATPKTNVFSALLDEDEDDASEEDLREGDEKIKNKFDEEDDDIINKMSSLKDRLAPLSAGALNKSPTKFSPSSSSSSSTESEQKRAKVRKDREEEEEEVDREEEERLKKAKEEANRIEEETRKQLASAVEQSASNANISTSNTKKTKRTYKPRAKTAAKKK